MTSSPVRYTPGNRDDLPSRCSAIAANEPLMRDTRPPGSGLPRKQGDCLRQYPLLLAQAPVPRSRCRTSSGLSARSPHPRSPVSRPLLEPPVLPASRWTDVPDPDSLKGARPDRTIPTHLLPALRRAGRLVFDIPPAPRLQTLNVHKSVQLRARVPLPRSVVMRQLSAQSPSERPKMLCSQRLSALC